MYDIDDLKNLVDMAAGGRSPADLLITNAKLVDVLTGEIRETDVSAWAAAKSSASRIPRL